MNQNHKLYFINLVIARCNQLRHKLMFVDNQIANIESRIKEPHKLTAYGDAVKAADNIRNRITSIEESIDMVKRLDKSFADFQHYHPELIPLGYLTDNPDLPESVNKILESRHSNSILLFKTIWCDDIIIGFCIHDTIELCPYPENTKPSIMLDVFFMNTSDDVFLDEWSAKNCYSIQRTIFHMSARIHDANISVKHENNAGLKYFYHAMLEQLGIDLWDQFEKDGILDMYPKNEHHHNDDDDDDEAHDVDDEPKYDVIEGDYENGKTD